MAKYEWQFGRAKVFANLDVAKVHFVVGGHARCDKKTETVVDEKLGISAVTCAKCKQYADYKKATFESPEAKPKPKAKKKAPKKKPKGKKQTANQDTTANSDAAANPANQDGGKGKTKGKKKKESPPKGKVTEENYKEHMKASQQPKTSDAMKHFVSKSSGRNPYIVHTPTGQTMFNNVEPKAVDTCLKYLNNVKIKWEKKEDPCPKGFTSAIRGAFEAAYKSLGIKTKVKGDKPKETPEQSAENAVQETLKIMAANATKGDFVVLLNNRYVFDGEKFVLSESEGSDIPKTEGSDIPKTEGKPKRKIKRRKKKDKPKTDKPKRQIKRRSKGKGKAKGKPKSDATKRTIKRRKKVDAYGFEKGSIRSYIAARLEKGGTITSICKKVAKKAGIDEKRANTKVKAIVRKFRQMDDFYILVYQQKSADQDIYKITEKL